MHPTRPRGIAGEVGAGPPIPPDRAPIHQLGTRTHQECDHVQRPLEHAGRFAVSTAGDRVAGDRVAGDRVAGDRVAGDKVGAAPGLGLAALAREQQQHPDRRAAGQGAAHGPQVDGAGSTQMLQPRAVLWTDRLCLEPSQPGGPAHLEPGQQVRPTYGSAQVEVRGTPPCGRAARHGGQARTRGLEAGAARTACGDGVVECVGQPGAQDALPARLACAAQGQGDGLARPKASARPGVPLPRGKPPRQGRQPTLRKGREHARDGAVQDGACASGQTQPPGGVGPGGAGMQSRAHTHPRAPSVRGHARGNDVLVVHRAGGRRPGSLGPRGTSNEVR